MELYMLGIFGALLLVASAIHGFARTHKGKMAAIWLVGVAIAAEGAAFVIVN